MVQLDKLFTFPIIMIDGDEEDRKKDEGFILGNEDAEPEIMYGEADVPYDAFMSVSDRWIPNEESRDRAKNGLFDACMVTFDSGMSYLVPWNKEKFKKKLREFAKDMPEPRGFDMKFLNLDSFKDSDDNNSRKGE